MSEGKQFDLAALTFETAEPLTGVAFQVDGVDHGPLEVKLIEVARFEHGGRRRRSAVPKREPFSMFFLGPPDPILPQAMYTLRCDQGTFNGLFLVPIGKDEEGTEYEAVFT
jgi:hypothetical protein